MDRSVYQPLLNSVANDYVMHGKQAGGLGKKFHSAIVELVKAETDGEFDSKKVLAAFDVAVTAMENHVKAEVEKEWGEGATLSNALPYFKNIKSLYRTSISKGLNPADYNGEFNLRKAKTELNQSKAEEGSTASGRASGEASDDNAPRSGEGSSGRDSGEVEAGGDRRAHDRRKGTVAEVLTDKLPEAVRKELDNYIKAVFEIAREDEKEAAAFVHKSAGIAWSQLKRNHPKVRAATAGK